jgi:hypothetical protein
VSIAFALAVGCGDAETFKTDPGHVDPADVPDDHACLLGSTMELSRYSSSCERTGTPLAASVQHGVVFTAEEVRKLTAPCDDGPAPGFDIVFDENSHSLFLDFSKVDADGTFPEAAFEGYTLDLILHEENGTLAAVSIDREASTLGLGTEDIVWAPDHIDLNLEGIRYDDESLLRLELVFVRIPPIEG